MAELAPLGQWLPPTLLPRCGHTTPQPHIGRYPGKTKQIVPMILIFSSSRSYMMLCGNDTQLPEPEIWKFSGTCLKVPCGLHPDILAQLSPFPGSPVSGFRMESFCGIPKEKIQELWMSFLLHDPVCAHDWELFSGQCNTDPASCCE